MPVAAFLLGDTRPIALSRGDALTIGRDRQNSVFMDDTQASRRHAAISCEENGDVAVGTAKGLAIFDLQTGQGVDRVATRLDLSP